MGRIQQIMHGDLGSSIQQRARWRFKRCFVSAGWYRGFILKNPNIKVSIIFSCSAHSQFFSLLVACLPAAYSHTPNLLARLLSRDSRPRWALISRSLCNRLLGHFASQAILAFTSRTVTITRLWHSKVALNEVMVPSTQVLAHLTEHPHSRGSGWEGNLNQCY